MSETSVDFEAEGLLEGLRGKARDGRRRLLAELAADGVPLSELRQAVHEDRLTLLPVERALTGGGPRFRPAEVAELSGVDREFLDREWRAMGLALAGEDEAVYTERDVEAARRVGALREAGLPEEGILEIARLLGMTMSQLAAANRRLIADALLRPGDTEHDAATRFAAAAQGFAPMLGAALSYAFNLHLREQLRHESIDVAAVSAGGGGSAEEVCVCFADLVGFTRLGERLPVEELGAVTGRLAELAGSVAAPPVRLVKLIGDAAMLAGANPTAVLDAGLALVAASEAEGEGFPLLRAGIASGPAVTRGGDYYGRPVNLASRITDVARPGSVLASEAVRDAVGDNGYRWSYARARHLKGIEGNVRLFRCRRAGADAD